jgi:PTH1 family peptidyl-tRNA hydrolase
MFLIVGLGNPSKEYEKTRHNVGFMAVDFLAENWQLGAFKKQKKLKAEILESVINDQKIILAKPQTFMNNSGEAVMALKKFFQIKNEQVVVVYDELDLPLGKIRVRTDGSSAGHNGIKSIIQNLGTDKFIRLRIGIRNELAEKMEAADFVLSRFSKEEKKALEKEILPAAREAIEKIISLDKVHIF